MVARAVGRDRQHRLGRRQDRRRRCAPAIARPSTRWSAGRTRCAPRSRSTASPSTSSAPGFVRTNVAVNAIQGDGSTRGHSDAAIEAGISPEAAAATILAGIAAGTREILVGDGPEMGLVALRGSDPDRLFDMMAGFAPVVAR